MPCGGGWFVSTRPKRQRKGLDITGSPGIMSSSNKETKMIKYNEIEGLQADHPKVKAFIAQEKLLDTHYASMLFMDPNAVMTENSLEYFNRYIAGDR
jgi:hypothetical protein